MNGKIVCLCALALTFLGAGLVRAQGPGAPMYGPALPAPPPAEAGQGLAPDGAIPAYGLSRWILYNQCDCCGPLSDRPPMRAELYVRAGPAFPIEGAVFGRTLDTGWVIQGGGRVLFFNEPQTKAWTFDLSLSNIHNNGRRPDIRVPIVDRVLIDNPNFNPFIPAGPDNLQLIPSTRTTQASIRSLNRTFVNLSGGREWYLIGNALGEGGPAWRFGADVGGRWGSGKVEFHQIQHRDDVLGSVFAAIHSDLDIPRGCCIFQLGVRAEWDYSWSDILQRQNDADMQDILLMATVGVRF